jgi:hypothetical protein
MPYRNIYCIICNNPPVLQSLSRSPDDGIILCVFEDFSSSVYENWKGNLNRLFFMKFKNISFNSYALLQSFKDIKIQNLQSVPRDVDDNKLDKNLKDHFTNIIAISSGIYPWRLCDIDVLPDVVQNVTTKNCDCSYSCLFHGKCTCCIDTALQHPLQSLNRIIVSSTNPSLNVDGLRFLVVSTCFQNRKGNSGRLFFAKIKYLCEEQSHLYDIPVIEAGVTYKNVFCFLCNRKVEDENEVSLHNGYKIMDFNIVCSDKIFHFLHKRNLQEILQEARKQNCEVFLDTEKAVISDEYSTTTVKTCPNNMIHESLRWACEKLDSQSFAPVHQYKNEFCELCNQMGHSELTGETNDEKECHKSSKTDEHFDNICPFLSKLADYPYFYPYRNIFCSYCAQGSGHKELVSKDSCNPVFGNVMRFKDRLIRELFLPDMTFPTVITEREKVSKHSSSTCLT